VTQYDIEHAVVYARLLDADAERADWREVSKIVLRIDPEKEVARAQLAYQSHLARAKWMTHTGYGHLLRIDIPSPN